MPLSRLVSRVVGWMIRKSMPVGARRRGGNPVNEVPQPAYFDGMLARKPVAAQPELLASDVTDKVVLITGAGGSIGSEICRQILPLNPRSVICVELNEFALATLLDEMEHLTQTVGIKSKIIGILGSCSDGPFMRRTMNRHAVETIYHAAAYKHVTMLETNVEIGVRNNVLGTRDLFEAAVEARVEKFVLVSSDKAVRPASVMGASKRFAELICQAAGNQPHAPSVCIVRFGNVLGSSGSVLPRFRAQIARGGPVTVTAPEATRYFMTAAEAAQLVLQAGALAKGGEVFHLDMGQPLSIYAMAQNLIRAAGQVPWTATSAADPQPPQTIEIRFTGLRQGEKPHEEILVTPYRQPTAHPSIWRAWEPMTSQADLAGHLARLSRALDLGNSRAIRDVLSSAPLDYTDPESDRGMANTFCPEAMGQDLQAQAS